MNCNFPLRQPKYKSELKFSIDKLSLKGTELNKSSCLFINLSSSNANLIKII